METVKEILLVTALVGILVAALFFGGQYVNTQNLASNGSSAINQLENGKEITLELDKKNNEKLNKYIEKYGDTTNGYVAYILSRIQVYSIPICTLLFVIGAFLYYIVSTKKLVEGEKGYGMIISSIFFLAIAQIAPLLFALISTIGRR